MNEPHDGWNTFEKVLYAFYAIGLWIVVLWLLELAETWFGAGG